MDEMIGRATAALNETWQRHGQRGDLRTAALSDGMATALVLSVIAALREPSEAMIDAAWDKADTADADDAWRAMIDVALGEK